MGRFRALAYVEDGVCRLVSRNGNVFKSFPDLATGLPNELRANAAVLDGEIVCLDSDGKSQFEELLFRRGEARFQAFDLLWCDGDDLRYSPLIERKVRLRAITPQRAAWLLYSGHVERKGEEFFKLAREHDLEGIVAKHRFMPYILDSEPSWLKIRNTDYSQWIGREELFERERANDPGFSLWDNCAWHVRPRRFELTLPRRALPAFQFLSRRQNIFKFPVEVFPISPALYE